LVPNRIINTWRAKTKILPAFLWRKVLKFDLGRVVMTVFEKITSQHFEMTLPQNNFVSNAIKRDDWIAVKESRCS